MRTGEMWAITKHGIDPDIMVTGKGLSGGMYPITAALLSDRAAQWLDQDGFGHISTFGGAELGCVAALKTLEITSRPEVRSSVHYIADIFAAGLARIQADHPDWFVGIRQNGVVIGLEFDHPEGAKFVMRELYQNGVWAIFSTLDPRVLQFKPGLLLNRDLCEDVLDRVEVAVGRAQAGRNRTEEAVTAVARRQVSCSSGRASPRPPTPTTTRTAVSRIVEAVAEAGHADAERFAAAAVAETEMGVVEDKVTKNRACSRGIVEFYRGQDFVTPRIDTARKIVEIPRPAGVVLALTPTTNPVATVYFKVILALMTRNAVVVAPHPRARQCSADAARMLAEAAVAAGAPDGIVQVIDEPSHPVGRSADVRRAHRCHRRHRRHRRGARRLLVGQPGSRCRPGQRPGVRRRDRRRRRRRATHRRQQGLRQLGAVHQRVGPDRRGRPSPRKLSSALTRHGAHILDADAASRLREYMFPDGAPEHRRRRP